MKKALRKALRFGLIIAALLTVAVITVLLLFFLNKPLVKNILLSQLGKRTGTTIRASRMDYSLFPFRLTVGELELSLENDLQKWGITLAHLEARGDFWKLVRGTKPALDTIEAEGADIRLEQKAFPEVPLDLRAIILQASDALALVKRISINDARLTVSLPSQFVSLENINLSLKPGDIESGTARSLSYSLGRSDVDVKDKGGAFRLRSGLTSSGTVRLGSSLGFNAAFGLDSPQLTIANIVQSLRRLTVDSTGDFIPAAKEIAVSRLVIDIPQLIGVEGTAKGKFGQGAYLLAEGTARIEKLENAAALLGPRLSAEFHRTKLRGRAVLSGKYGIQRSNGKTSDKLEGSVTFEGVDLDSILKGLPLHVHASGKVHAAGPLKSPQVSADIRSSVGKVTSGNVSVGNSELHVVATGTKEMVNISKLEATLKSLLIGAAEGKKLFFDKVILKGKAGFDHRRKTAALSSLQAQFPGIAPLFISGQYGMETASGAQVRLETRGLDIPALRRLAAPFLPESLAGWNLDGRADILLEVSRPAAPEAAWRFSGTLSLDQARLNDPSFTIAGEGLDPVLKLEGEYDASKELSFRGALDVGHGESLWKAVYVSWSKHPLELTAAGRYYLESGRIDGLAARFLLSTIGEVNLSGSIETHPLLSFDLRSDARLSLGPLYSLYTEADVSRQNRMTIKGTMGAGLKVKKEGADLSVTGRVNLADLNLDRPATKTVLLDIEAELPVHYELGKDVTDSPDGLFPEEGFLRIGELRNPFLTLQQVAVPLRADANAFSVEPFAQELYGGRLDVGRTVFKVDPKSGFLRGVGSLALHDLDIARLPIQSPKFKLTGKVQAEFPRLDISPKEIAVSGQGEAEVFGGKVVIRDLAVSNPFTPDRSISLNIDLLDLDLKKLTDEIPFGEVTGIVRGEVRNLVISYRQPEKFEFRIESVPRKGVPQTFSLKAVDNLTVLSSGERATGSTGQFWMRFIRGFRYEKLGIVSTLRNDTFTLNGTIREGGVEYLVKKPALIGINVINRMPEKRISFKEMTSRLRRVGQSEK